MHNLNPEIIAYSANLVRRRIAELDSFITEELTHLSPMREIVAKWQAERKKAKAYLAKLESFVS